jgi:dTDP-4-dehydrorhamnose reductase
VTQRLSSDAGRNILILGSGGQLGSELHKLYPNATCYDHSSGGAYYLDLQDNEKLEQSILSSKCKWIINAAAFTNVDACEMNKEIAYRVNGLAVKSIVKAARQIGSSVLQVSTDYIFDGKKGLYKESDIPNPLNFYGISKLIGEVLAMGFENSLIIRTSGVYGSKNNFPNFAYRQMMSGKHLKVLDGYYSPIHARNLALAIKNLIENDSKGILNVAGTRISRIELALEIARKYNLDENLINKVEKMESMKAIRPFDSSLDISNAKKALNFDFYSVESNLKSFDFSISKA